MRVKTKILLTEGFAIKLKIIQRYFLFSKTTYPKKINSIPGYIL